MVVYDLIFSKSDFCSAEKSPSDLYWSWETTEIRFTELCDFIGSESWFTSVEKTAPITSGT